MLNLFVDLRRALCDTKDSGKLSDEQFALAFYFINQKLTKGIDPPQVLSPDMIPPSERSTLQKVKICLHFRKHIGHRRANKIVLACGLATWEGMY